VCAFITGGKKVTKETDMNFTKIITENTIGGDMCLCHPHGAVVLTYSYRWQLCRIMT
jgi:hypothetical protein